jgi:uncharacterized protein (DUF1499 family)
VSLTLCSQTTATQNKEPAQLEPCPGSPNCVSSLAEDSRHRIEPFSISGSAEETLGRLRRVIGTFPRTRVLFQGSRYLKTEFKTALGFIDIVEFLVDENEGRVHVRSASREGYWDLGVNRRRVENIRRVYQEGIKTK